MLAWKMDVKPNMMKINMVVTLNNARSGVDKSFFCQYVAVPNLYDVYVYHTSYQQKCIYIYYYYCIYSVSVKMFSCFLISNCLN